MERPIIKDAKTLAYIEYLQSKLDKYESSDILDTYLTIKGQLNDFNAQLKIREEKSSLGEKVVKGRIDLFADKESKEFDRAWKFMNEALDINKRLLELKKLMTPDEVVKAGERKMNEQSSAERHIFKAKGE